MKKLYWLRRLSMLIVIFSLGALSTGAAKKWILILFCINIFAYVLLAEEIIYGLKRN